MSGETKIVHIINGLDLGGSETALYRFLSATHSEFKFAVIVLGKPGHYSPYIRHLDIPIYYLSLQKCNFIQAIYRLFRLIKQIKPDIVQTWLYHSDLLGGLCAKLNGVKKIIWSIRCEGVHLKPSTQRIQKFCAFLSKAIPDHIITNSNTALNHHVRLGYCSKNMRVIYNGFDINQFSAASHRSKNNTITIGTLARFHSDKGYENFIRAINIINEQYPSVQFTLCGQGCHADNPAFKSLLDALNHQNNIRLIDKIDDTPAYLNELDIFILPSKTEGFPNSLAEAMLCECVCVATDVGETRQILGEAGFLVPSEDPQQLAAACITLILKSSEERQQLGALARERIIHHYSMSNHLMKMNSLYFKGNKHLCVD